MCAMCMIPPYDIRHDYHQLPALSEKKDFMFLLSRPFCKILTDCLQNKIQKNCKQPHANTHTQHTIFSLPPPPHHHPPPRCLHTHTYCLQPHRLKTHPSLHSFAFQRSKKTTTNKPNNTDLRTKIIKGTATRDIVLWKNPQQTKSSSLIVWQLRIRLKKK